MKKLIRRMNAATKLNPDIDVERDPDGSPIAFLIWRAGVVYTDHGNALFDKQAASLLMAERDRRGNRYSIDYDHMSLSDKAPPEAHIAAGSFDLEMRNGDLWAVAVRWTTRAREGLREGGWLSISPAYDINPDSLRIVSLLNVALTSNPATWGATRIAAGRRRSGQLAASDFSLSDLRLLARDAELGHLALRELARRGESALDPKGDDARRMASAFGPFGGGGNRPTTRRVRR